MLIDFRAKRQVSPVAPVAPTPVSTPEPRIAHAPAVPIILIDEKQDWFLPWAAEHLLEIALFLLVLFGFSNGPHAGIMFIGLTVGGYCGGRKGWAAALGGVGWYAHGLAGLAIGAALGWLSADALIRRDHVAAAQAGKELGRLYGIIIAGVIAHAAGAGFEGVLALVIFGWLGGVIGGFLPGFSRALRGLGADDLT